MNSKLVIGTANFSQSYGFNKYKSKLSLKTIKKILKYANKHGVKNLDTAISYGSTEKILGKLNLRTYQILTKLPKLPKNCRNVERWVSKNITNSIKRLKVKKISGIFFHHAEDLLGRNKKSLYNSLRKAKEKGLVDKIGVSIYNFKTLGKILKEFKLDIVQVPFSVFDRRLEHFKYLKKIKEKKVKIYIRSIFLQGLLLLNENKIPKKFSKWHLLFKNWHTWTKDKKISSLKACINYVFSFKEIDKIIIGVNNLKQIKQIFEAVNNNNGVYPKNIFSNNASLINPIKWKRSKKKVKKTKIICIVQARTKSTRFPNKVLQRINGKTIIEILFKRLSQSKKINKIIFAIPDNPEENDLKKNILSLGCDLYEGSENDVLDRYYQSAKKFNSNIIVRITGDCPLIDSSLVDQVILKLINNKLDFVSNYAPPTYPDGLDVAACTMKTLKRAWKETKNVYDREHVMNYIVNSKKFSKYNLELKKNLSKYRWTIDEPEDFVVIKNILNHFKNKYNFSWTDIVKLEKAHPEYFIPNKHILRDEGSNLSVEQKLWKRAKKIILGGNMLLSKRPEIFLPGKWPTYFSKSKGCKIWDLEGKEYLDMSTMGIGTNILGYGHPEIDEAVKKTVEKGNMSTLNCPEEVYLSEKLILMHPWSNMVKLTRSGGEANAVAIRIARAASGKDKVAICGYHGWHDWYLAANLSNKDELKKHHLSGLKPLGVPKKLLGSTLTFSYNNISELENLIKKNKDIGTIKMEVSRNIEPKLGFLKKVRELANKNKIILIFDECTSGFRQTFGGLHKLYKVDPDIAIFGKALGNGYAINAVIGKKEIMQFAQSTFISSTFWTERIGPVAALKTLDVMEKEKSWKTITEKGNKVKKMWLQLAKKYNITIQLWGIPALAGFNIQSKNFLHYKTLISQELLKDSILASNTIYFSTEHSDKYINQYFASLEKVFNLIAECENGRDINSLLEGPVSYNTYERLN